MTSIISAMDADGIINLAPVTVAEEVSQNVAMILSTIKNSVPLYRDFGISVRFIDTRMPTTEAIIIAEIFDAIERHEPRAEIKNITFERDERLGKIIPRLEVEINGG